MAGEWMLKDDWDSIDGLGAENARLQAEVDALKLRVMAAARVLLAFAGRLGVGDDELADLLADAEMREERP